MKKLFKLLFLFMGVGLLAASCNNSTATDANDTNGIVDSIPIDSTASGDTAVVIDTTM